MNTGPQVLKPQQSEVIPNPASQLQENDAMNLQALEEEEDVEGTLRASSLGIEEQAVIL
jgi:hypothetical protein